MKRLLFGLVLIAACDKAPPADPKFEQEWKQLAQGGSEPLFIEGEKHGAGLMGEVRRAVDPMPDKIGMTGTAITGPLPDTEAVKVIRSQLPGVKACYAVEERAGTVGSGKAIVSLEIKPDGTVGEVKIDAPAFSKSNLGNCLSNRAKSWAFPKFTAGPKKISYPFVFVGG